MTRTATIHLPLDTLLPGHQPVNDACTDELLQSVMSLAGVSAARTEREDGDLHFVLNYDPAANSQGPLLEQVAAEATRVRRKFQHDQLQLAGLHCGHCATKIEAVIAALPGVFSSSVNFGSETLRVGRDSSLVSKASINQTVRELGYRVQPERPAAPGDPRKAGRWPLAPDLSLSLLAGLILILTWLGSTFSGLPAPITTALYLLSYAAGGYHAATHAFRAARKRRFDIDVLMISAALGAAALGQFAEGALLLFLFSLGHALQNHATQRARGAIRALAGLTPSTARILRNGQEAELPVEQLEPGDIVLVRDGERIPADATVITGESSINQAPITGESIPVQKSPGDTVFAGTINGDGALQLRNTKRHSDTTLARVIRLVEEAQAAKSPTQRFSDRLERVLVPAILLLAFMLVIVPPLLGFPFRPAFLKAMTLLVAASPCALALATPSAVLSSVARAARGGVLIKGGAHLEAAGSASVVAFDKTGTLTRGTPTLTDIDAVDGDTDTLLRFAATAELGSSHPLASAVLQAAADRNLQLGQPDRFTAQQGRGISALVDTRPVLVGNSDFMRHNAIHLGRAESEAQRLEAEGKTLLLVAVDNTYAGLLALRDELRPEAKASIKALRQAGISRLIMLTGDNERVAASLASELGLDEVKAGLLPEQKAEAIRELQAAHGAVIMVGDGVNDAPALAQADVGIAIGGATNDVALETADIALLSGNLHNLPFALDLSRTSRRLIRQNLLISLGVILLLVPAALFGLAGIGSAIILHEGSTLVVVANALRLLGFKNSSLATAS